MALDKMMIEYGKMRLSADVAKNLKNLASIKDFENLFSELLKSIPSQRRQVLLEWIESVSNEKQTVEKNSEKSFEMRKKGNKLYAKSKTMDDFFEVFRAYNESIAYAPIKSEELALSYANRAMVLFRLKYFNECLTDINRALCSNYPDKTMGKLLIKKIRCMKIVNHPDLQLIYNDCLEWIDKHAENVQELRTEIKKAFEEDAPPYSAPVNMKFRDDLLEEMKKLCPNLDKIEIGRTNDGELALVATRDIHVGEVVAVQKMYTQIFHMEKPYLACWQCIVVCLNPVPCDCCTMATYCSESCKAEAWSKHHEYECQIMFVIKRCMPDFLLPIRICMYAMKQLGGILPLMKEVYKMSKTDDMKDEHRIVEGAYPSESYRSVYYMMNKSSVANLKYVEDGLRVGIAVYFIATRTTLFNKQYHGEMLTVMGEREPKFFASLILRHFVMLQHLQTSAIRLPNNIVMGSTAVCPLLYIMNHSCNPNSVKLTLKDHQVVLAIDEIKKGQIINYSYTTEALVGESTARRIAITQEMFTLPCRCEVCSMKIPPKLLPFKVLEKNPEKLKELSIICRKIEKKVDIHGLCDSPKTAAEYLQQTAELSKDLEAVFAIAPSLCEERIDLKNVFMNIVCSRLNSKIYNLFKLNVF